MHNRLVFNEVSRAKPKRFVLELLLQIALVSILVVLLGFLAYFALVVVPEIKAASEMIKSTQEDMIHQSDAEGERRKLLEAARKREIMNEAEMLRQQEANLEAAKRLNDRLKGKE